MAGDMKGCEGLAEIVVEANTAMIPLYEKIEVTMDSSKVDCGVPDRTNDKLWGELRACATDAGTAAGIVGTAGTV